MQPSRRPLLSSPLLSSPLLSSTLLYSALLKVPLPGNWHHIYFILNQPLPVLTDYRPPQAHAPRRRHCPIPEHDLPYQILNFLYFPPAASLHYSFWLRQTKSGLWPVYRLCSTGIGCTLCVACDRYTGCAAQVLAWTLCVACDRYTCCAA